ncbi:MAG: ABC transporter ATP-binding protein [bacterium]|jgi:ABC-2 type transport system ATP-binding protein|nr:ABC transporter ATP-binding protein [candidate division KSB1 bacterium]MDH7558936.1 ABC transporter ATP-binding protein [bacterium]
MIVAEDLSKRYGSTLAVDGLSLTVEGELFVFLGPNGAGKTTTIKLMTGLLRPDRGHVRINGFDVATQPLQAKGCLGLVPERPYVYPKLTGREFLFFMADLYRVDRATAVRRFEHLVELFDLAGHIDRLIETYSHGMKQKIALSGALIHDSKVLFLDEPTVGLDPKSARNLKSLLKGLVQRGVTVFMSTHILEIAESMCDRVGIIDKGKLIALGTMAELRGKSSRRQSLEDIFLELTGGDEYREVLKYLEES